jgi:hypothetical protein
MASSAGRHTRRVTACWRVGSATHRPVWNHELLCAPGRVVHGRHESTALCLVGPEGRTARDAPNIVRDLRGARGDPHQSGVSTARTRPVITVSSTSTSTIYRPCSASSSRRSTAPAGTSTPPTLRRHLSHRQLCPGDQWLQTNAAETDLAAASKVVDRAHKTSIWERTTLLGRTEPGRCARVVRRRGRTAARARYRFDTSPRTLR